MRPLLVLTFLMVTLPTLAAEGDLRPEEDACQADIHRLCDKFFPDAKLVATCLVDKRAELSPACAELLANPPQADAPASSEAPVR